MATTLSLTTASMAFADDAANEQQAPATTVAATTVTSTSTTPNEAKPQVKVPMSDVRGGNIGAVQFGAAQTSRDAPVVVFYSKDYTADEIRTAFPEVRETIRESIANGDPVTGLLVASEREAIEIFAYGQMIEGEVPPYDNLRNKMLNGIKNGNAYIKQEKALKAKENHAAPKN